MGIIARLSALAQRLASWRVLAVTAAAFVVCAGAFFATSLPFSIARVTAVCGAAPPDTRFYTSADGVHQFLTGCGEAGRGAYRNLQLADLLYPAVVALFLASALAVVLSRLSRPGSPLVAWAALPLLASAFDYLENAAAWTALLTYPGHAGTATALLGFASVAKQAVSWASWVLLLVAVGCLIVRRGLSPATRSGSSRSRQPAGSAIRSIR